MNSGWFIYFIKICGHSVNVYGNTLFFRVMSSNLIDYSNKTDQAYDIIYNIMPQLLIIILRSLGFHIKYANRRICCIFCLGGEYTKDVLVFLP